MKIYEKTSLIECSLEALFAFHIDTKNLQTISPKNIKVTLLNKDFVAKEGAILKLKTVQNFLPIVWEVKIEKLEKPSLLVDVAIKSPFKFWKHSHIFTQKEDGVCELKDRVQYTLPFGFLNCLLDSFVYHQLEAMFVYRHHVSKELLEAK
ncbi:MAG: SRPBCC family protein [Sulfurimonas sp.]|nr:SRPBCC family protein [Sulfurimonas sp.]